MSMNMLPLFAIAAFCLAGCGIVLTGDTEDKVQPHGVYQAERVNLARYKSVQTRPGQNPDVAVAVAISGGGERAANYGVGVLLGLEAMHALKAHWDHDDGSPRWFSTIGRILDISLDSWRGRYKEIVRALANQDSRSNPGDAVEPRPLGCKAHVVFLGFEELIANLSDKEPTDSGALRSWQRRLACEKEIYNRRSERDAKDTDTSKTPVSAINDEFRRNWREVEGVSTSLNVTPQQQEDLLIAGQMVVCLHEPEIAAELSNADYRP